MNQLNLENSKYDNVVNLSKLNNFIDHGGLRLIGEKKFIKTQSPKITIITVVKNAEKTIEKTIDSILSQNYENLEIIVIEGNSSDNTLNVIKKFNKNIDYWCSINDRGIYDAMNYGIKLSTGDIIGILNSGDIFAENALKLVSKYFENNKNISFLFGTVERNYLGNNKIIKHGFNKKRIKYNFDSVTCHSSGFFIKNYVHKKIGLYNLNYKCSSDYDFFFRLLTKSEYIGLSTKKSEIIGVVASGGFSSKYGYWNRLKEEMIIRKDNKQNYFIILIIFLNILIKTIMKKLKII